MNAWSSVACRLLETASDWRCAAAANAGERTSGTQIWMGRNPWRRRRSRCARTLSQDGLELFDFAMSPPASEIHNYSSDSVPRCFRSRLSNSYETAGPVATRLKSLCARSITALGTSRMAEDAASIQASPTACASGGGGDCRQFLGSAEGLTGRTKASSKVTLMVE